MQTAITMLKQFQSAPGLATGGNVQRKPNTPVNQPFQSAPGLATGGNGRRQIRPCRHRGVSIRPRSRDRGKLASMPKGGMANSLFQSAPGLATGGNYGTTILTRLRGARFNPPPVSRPGETQMHDTIALARQSFNPPPVSRPGETSATATVSPGIGQFQSAPGLATGGNLQAARSRRQQLQFQSAPGLATGGNDLENVLPLLADDVSIRPRSRDRGKRRSRRVRAAASCFNPPPVSRPGETTL